MNRFILQSLSRKENGHGAKESLRRLCRSFVDTGNLGCGPCLGRRSLQLSLRRRRGQLPLQLSHRRLRREWQSLRRLSLRRLRWRSLRWLSLRFWWLRRLSLRRLPLRRLRRGSLRLLSPLLTTISLVKADGFRSRASFARLNPSPDGLTHRVS